MSRRPRNIIREYFDPYEMLRRRHPKAAKKRRVLKKWAARHPQSLSLRYERLESRNPFFDWLKTENEFVGGTFMIPIQWEPG